MKNTPIQKGGVHSYYYVLSILFLFSFFVSFYASSQLGKPKSDSLFIQTKSPGDISPSDTLDVYVCMGNVLIAKPIIQPDTDPNGSIPYVWKSFAPASSVGTTVDSGTKKLKDITLTITNTKQPIPFCVSIAMGYISEGHFFIQFFRIIKIHPIAPPPAPTVNTVPVLHFGDYANLQANSSTSSTDYIWYSKTYTQIFGGASFNVGPITKDTSFYVIARQFYSDGGESYCVSDPTRVDITIKNPVFIPNVFTPNADGLNDVFKVEGTYFLNNGTLRIYNQWGASIFQTNDLNKGWDGKVNGQLQPAGVYVYMLDATLASGGERLKKHGAVTLLR